MPESFNDCAITDGAPARLGGAQGATNADPSSKGVAAGGTDNISATRETYEAGSTRPEGSALRSTRAAVATFEPAGV